MPQVSTEALRAFNEALEGCAKAIDGKQIELDLACVYRLVQNNKEAAYLSTELKCILAQHQPNYLKVAAFVAASYQFAFHDDALVTNASSGALQTTQPSRISTRPRRACTTTWILASRYVIRASVKGWRGRT